jgi:hypothetical protein
MAEENTLNKKPVYKKMVVLAYRSIYYDWCYEPE